MNNGGLPLTINCARRRLDGGKILATLYNHARFGVCV